MRLWSSDPMSLAIATVLTFTSVGCKMAYSNPAGPLSVLNVGNAFRIATMVAGAVVDVLRRADLT